MIALRSLAVAAVLLSLCAQSTFAQEALTGRPPAAIVIPRAGTNASVVLVGLDAGLALEAPTDPDTVGWYESGPGVGGAGNMLLDGHVDWGGRLRVFGLIKTLRPGDGMQITDVDGNTLDYVVEWTQLFDNALAPLDDIYAQPPGQHVTLITCGGRFDQAAHTYLDRWVVRAVRVDE